MAQDYVLHSPSPADGATDIPVGWVYLSCNTSDDYYGTGIYEVQYSTKPDFSSKRSIRTSNRVYGVDINADKPGTVYYWRVLEYSLSTGYFEQVSPVWHFTTAGTPPAGDCDLSDVPTSSDYYAATYFLCERSVLNGSKEDGKTNVEGVLKRSHLAKIAFRGVYLLNGREMPATVASDYYPTVYEDIAVKTTDNDYYYQAARALLYLEYGDGVSPFDRNQGHEIYCSVKDFPEEFFIKFMDGGKVKKIKLADINPVFHKSKEANYTILLELWECIKVNM